MTVAVIVQARTGSHRLPNKVVAPVMGRPLLAYELQRIRHARHFQQAIVATTTRPQDDVVADLAASAGWWVFRGSEDDVLARYIGAARETGADVVVRATGDCPLIDPATIEALIERYAQGDADHVEIAGLPDGMGAEILSLALLEQIAAAPDLTAEDREHVALYIRKRPARFQLRRVETKLGLDRERWTVDTPEDLLLITRILETLWPRSPYFTIADIRSVLAAHPDWVKLNAHVQSGPIEDRLMAMRGIPPRGRDFAPWLGDL